VFSFHATKSFHTFEGGAVTTNDDALATRMREMRAFGLASPECSAREGINAKMTEVCAAMGLANLDHVLPGIDASRRVGSLYRELLDAVPGVRMYIHPEGCRSNWQYVILEVGADSASTRDQMVQALRADGVLARRYFWPACHRMEPYVGRSRHLPHPLPHTDAVAARVIALPAGPSLSERDVETVCAIIRIMATG
jgi:dTDP-4-amino-4,6-dideoxygalactose transaminase